MKLWAIFLLMEDPDSAWWDDVRTEDVVETRDRILIRSFREGYDNTVSALGKNRDNWRWGKLHNSTFVSNPLGQSGIGLIERMVNRGPVDTSGTTDAVNATSWPASSGEVTVNQIPSMRMIIDLSDLDRSVCVNNTGQSGHPYSPHYDDMIDMWRNIEYHPMLWSGVEIETSAMDKLVLSPGE